MATTRFLHHANAVALGGRIVRPFNEVIESQASAVLPISGGFGTARVENFRFHEVTSFRAAASTVTGSDSDDGRAHHGLATVTIEGLNVGGGMVTADAVVARLASMHDQGSGYAPHLLPVGSYFVNLRIAGVLVDLKPRGDLHKSRLMDDVATACGNRVGQSRAQAVTQYKGEKRILASLFDPPDPPPGCDKEVLDAADICWGLRVPEFGTVFIGELLATRYTRRLTMLRIELGSPIKGTVTAAIVEGNGSLYP